TAAQFNALDLTVGQHGTYDLSISATTIGAEAGTTTESYALKIVDPPTLTISDNSLSVSPFGAVLLGISDSNDASDSVIISGVPHSATLSVGTNNGDGSWSLTAAQLTGLTLTAGGIDSLSYASPTIATLDVPSAPNTQLVGINDANYILANIN